MTTEILPYEMRETTDISRFENFAVPTRKMTSSERATYDKLGYDWARIDASAQKLVYAAMVQNKLQDFFIVVFARGLNFAYATLGEVTDPRGYAVMEEYVKGMLRQTAQINATFRDTSARKMGQILDESFPEPQTDNIFRRLLGSPKMRRYG